MVGAEALDFGGKERRTMPNKHAGHLILRHQAMQNERKGHQDPRQIGGGKDQQTQETEPRVRIASAPDVDDGAAEGGAEEGLRDEGREEEQDGAGVQEQPGEVGRGAARGFFEQARVALLEEDVEEEVEV